MEPQSTAATSSTRTPSASPAMDVVAPPVAEAEEAGNDRASKSAANNTKPAQQVSAAAKSAKKQPAVKSAKSKQPQSGVGLAIAATVLIVLGLAGLATYAYLQTAR